MIEDRHLRFPIHLLRQHSNTRFHPVARMKRRMASMWSAGVFSPAFMVLKVR
jgi:hypothetical protein